MLDLAPVPQILTPQSGEREGCGSGRVPYRLLIKTRELAAQHRYVANANHFRVKINKTWTLNNVSGIQYIQRLRRSTNDCTCVSLDTR